MECIIAATKAAESNAAAAAAAPAATLPSTAPTATKRSKATTPGAVARERAAARNPSSSPKAGSSGIIAPPGSKSDNPQSIFNTPRLRKQGGAKKQKSAGAGAGEYGGLLDEDDEDFLPKALAALHEVFRRFDTVHASDPSAPLGSLCWGVEDIQRFAVATNGRPFTEEELTEITTNLQHDQQGRLTAQGFLDFYHLQTSSHVSAWRRTEWH